MSPTPAAESGPRWTRRAPLAAGIGALALYLPTLAPDLTWRSGGADGGDLLTAAAQLGIAHPTGYPTYTLLAAAFLGLPAGSPAWRVHLLSALAAALAVGLATATARRVAAPGAARPDAGGAAGAALITGLTLAAVPLLWSQATIAEVYSLLAAFTAGCTWLAVGSSGRIAAGRDATVPVLALAFLSGLALTHHLTIAPVLLCLWGYVGWAARAARLTTQADGAPAAGRGRLALAGAGFAAFAAGLLPLLYLPLRAGQAAMSDWDYPATLAGLWRMLSGADYHYLLFHRTALETATALTPWLQTLVFGLGALAAPVTLLGLIRLWVTRRAWAVTGLLIVGANGVYTAIYAATDTQPYWLIGLVIVSGWLAAGLSVLGTRYSVLGTRYSVLAAGLFLLANSGPSVGPGLAGVAFPLPGAAPLGEDAPAWLDRTLPALPPDTILLSIADEQTFGLWYARYVAGRRPDVLTLDVRLLDTAWFRDNVRQHNPDVAAALPDAADRLAPLIAATGRRRPVLALTDRLVLPPGWRWQPQTGGLWRALPP